MFGGLTKTSSRIAIAAACGLLVGGFAFKATPALAADLGGDCCADLEERVAELEATTVRKGNKKVSVTLSGWVVKSMNWWHDGDKDHFVVGDKDYDLGTRFAITGSAQIAPGWSAGYNITVNTQATIFGFAANQFDDLGGTFGDISTLYSYIYIKSDTLGTLNWGHLSPASDNPAVLADISGTVIESNAVFFEGPGFFLRPKGAVGGDAGLSGLTWGNLITCQGLGAGIGVDCWGAAQPAVRYDSPTWGGFRFETSYGKNQASGPLLPPGHFNSNGHFEHINTSDTDFWDIAVFYTADWNSIKLSAAVAYTWIETGVVTLEDTDLWQAGASIMHKPSGLGIYGMYQHEASDGSFVYQTGGFALTGIAGDPDRFVSIGNPDTDAWYVKPFWRKAWSPIGATVLYGEYGQYNDQFSAARGDVCPAFGFGTNVGNFCTSQAIGVDFGQAFVTGSEVERWGLGVVQEIDSAAMHLWIRWQHNDVSSLNLVGFSTDPGDECFDGCRVKQGFDDWDLFQVGGVIFF